MGKEQPGASIKLVKIDGERKRTRRVGRWRRREVWERRMQM